MKTGAWAALKSLPDGKWKVDGAAIDRDFFFKKINARQASAYADPTRWRFVFCPEGVRIGTIVTIEGDLANPRVVWP